MQRLEKGGVQSGQPDRPKLEKRIKLLEKAYSQKPQDRQLTYNLALAYFQAGNSNKTLKLVGSRAQKPEELFLKGMSCYKLQNYSCTTDSLAKIEHDEKLGLESRLFLGLSLMELKKWQEAQKYMTAFLAQMTDDHPAHCHITHLLGKAAFHLETYSRSANYFLTAGKCSDLYYKDYFNAAVALGRLGQTAKAISVLEKNYNRDLNTGVINFWARLYLKENNQASAEKILQRGKTKDSLTYLLLGRLAFQKGAVSKAKDYFQKAKKHNQNQQLAPAISQHIKLVKEL